MISSSWIKYARGGAAHVDDDATRDDDDRGVNVIIPRRSHGQGEPEGREAGVEAAHRLVAVKASEETDGELELTTHTASARAGTLSSVVQRECKVSC